MASEAAFAASQPRGTSGNTLIENNADAFSVQFGAAGNFCNTITKPNQKNSHSTR